MTGGGGSSDRQHDKQSRLFFFIHKAVITYNFAVDLHRVLGCARSFAVREVGSEKPELLRIPGTPLEVVHERPGEVALHVAAVLLHS